MHVRFWQNLRFFGVTHSLLEPHSIRIISGSNLKRENSRRKTFEQIANFSLNSIFFCSFWDLKLGAVGLVNDRILSNGLILAQKCA